MLLIPSQIFIFNTMARSQLFAFALLLWLISCAHARPRSYAIRDFPEKLQPYLQQAIDLGVFRYDDPPVYLQDSTTDDELVRLSEAENPLLRLIALDARANRPGFDPTQVLMTHLDDTAAVFLDQGGIEALKATVSDVLVVRGVWKTESARDSLAVDILLHHSRLDAVYRAIEHVPLLPQYHDRIQEIALRPQSAFPGEAMTALAVLAQYRRKEDIPFIRDLLVENENRLTVKAFDLMRHFPDSSYLPLLERYYPRGFDRDLYRLRNELVPKAYIRTLATYEQDTCAAILASILRSPAPYRLRPARDYFWDDVLQAVWSNRCPAYETLLSRYGKDMRRLLVSDSLDGLSHAPLAADTAALPRNPKGKWVRW